jgi:APA family basic amino acid/polyamine antiporter
VSGAPALGSPSPALRRVLGVPGAVLLGLGSILGTGIFVSAALAAGVAGAGVVPALVLAGALALVNGLASAQLAASHPVSGGTYEYGYRYLTPALGFAAGWLFLCAKTASAAAAARGLSAYALAALGLSDAAGAAGRAALAAAIVGAIAAVAAGGVQRSGRVNAAIVAVTVGGLGALVVAGAPAALARGGEHLAGALATPAPALLHAAALLFVAFTGYGRIATLGEEVRDPARTIPRALVVALALALALYLAVVAVVVGAAGPAGLAAAGQGGAPLDAIAAGLGVPGVRAAVGIAAIAAMLGVILSLVLGLSRVVLAMARRGDLPRALAAIEPGAASPRRAVLTVGGAIAALAVVADVRVTWALSALTVLVYYAITNLAALRLAPAARRYPRPLAAVGLASCLGLAWWVEPAIWGLGGILLAAGLAARWAARAAA